MDDLALLHKWRIEREAGAFKQIVTRHAGMVYATCRRILGNAQDAEDVAQECFELLAEGRGNPKEQLGAWLHKVATNRALDRLRTDKRRRTREAKFTMAEETSAMIEWNEIYRCVDEALEELPEKFRVPMIASFLESETNVVIARKLGLSPAAAAYRIDKGIGLLRKSLRRKGINVSIGSLSALMTAHAAEAAPATLTLTLGKLALAGAGSAAAPSVSSAASTGTFLGGMLVMKTTIVLAVVVVLTGLAFVQLNPSTDEESVVAAAQEEVAPPLDVPEPDVFEAPVAESEPEELVLAVVPAPTGGTRANALLGLPINQLILASTEADSNEIRTLNFPSSSVGQVSARNEGSTGFFDWKGIHEAQGRVEVLGNSDVALFINPETTGDISFLESIDADALNALALGSFYVYRAGVNEPSRAHAESLRTSGRIRPNISDDEIAHITHLKGLSELYLNESFVGDNGVRLVSSLYNLEVLGLAGTEISDAALSYLANLPSLRKLDLSRTQITDAGLQKLSLVQSLEELVLDRTSVSDAGMNYLSGLPNLARLSLNHTRVTEEGLGELSRLPSLERLSCWNTGVASGAKKGILPRTVKDNGYPRPRVGILFTTTSADTLHSMPHPYSYQHTIGIAELLDDFGYELFAVIEQKEHGEADLQSVLDHLGFHENILYLEEPSHLSNLDAVVSGHTPLVSIPAIKSLTTDIENGLGFVDVSIFGNREPGYGNSDLSQLLGIRNGNYHLDFAYLKCPVLRSHPILGPLKPGDLFEIKWLNSGAGAVDGTALLGRPSGSPIDVSPLYVREMGQGRLVNIQWQQPSTTNGGISAEDFYARCVNWAMRVPVDSRW